MPKWSPLRVALVTAVVALMVHGGDVALKAGLHPDHTILAVFRVGGLFPAHPRFVTDERYPMETAGFGTDGQEYLYVAHDPFLRLPPAESMARFLDVPRYRYGRILLPALAATTCGGSSPCIPRAIVAWNGFFAAGIGALAALLVRARNAHPAWGLMLACTGGLLCATDIGNVEVCAQFFGLLGVLLLARRDEGVTKYAIAAVAFALSALARETYVLVPAGFALAALLSSSRSRQASWSRAMILASSALPAAAWALFVRTRIPATGSGVSENLSPPGWGIVVHVIEFAKNPRVTGLTLLALVTAVPFLWMMARHLRAVVRGERDGLSIATALFILLSMVSARAVWASPGGFARGLDFVYPGVVLCALARSDRFTAWLATPTLIHSANIVIDHFVRRG